MSALGTGGESGVCSSLLFFDIYLFIWLCRLLLAALGFLLCHAGSSIVVLGFSCPMACGILVPQPGIKLVSPQLQSRFLTTGPLGKSPIPTFLSSLI